MQKSCLVVNEKHNSHINIYGTSPSKIEAIFQEGEFEAINFLINGDLTQGVIQRSSITENLVYFCPIV